MIFLYKTMLVGTLPKNTQKEQLKEYLCNPFVVGLQLKQWIAFEENSEQIMMRKEGREEGPLILKEGSNKQHSPLHVLG